MPDQSETTHVTQWGVESPDGSVWTYHDGVIARIVSREQRKPVLRRTVTTTPWEVDSENIGHETGTLRWLAVQNEAHELLRDHPDWRWGQALFNALRMMDPPLAEQIRGTTADPFHDNIRCPEFMDAVMHGMRTPPGPTGGEDRG